MEYRIFRLTSEGYLKDIGYRSYQIYLEAERVVLAKKKEKPKQKLIILKLY